MYSTANKPRIQPTSRARLNTPQVGEAIMAQGQRLEELERRLQEADTQRAEARRLLAELVHLVETEGPDLNWIALQPFRIYLIKAGVL